MLNRSDGIPTFGDYVRAPSGLILPEAEVERQIRAARRPKAMDFFCGAGGMSLGLMQGGFEVVAAAENDPHSAITYMTNLSRWGHLTIHFVEEADRQRLEKVLDPGKKSRKASAIHRMPLAGSGWISGQPSSQPGVSHFFFGDVRKLTSARILSELGMKRGDLDLVAGGPPCQGYSHAGMRDVMDPRSSLLFEFARFVVELSPKTMAMENVPGIMTMLTPDGQPVLDQFCRILEDGSFGGYDAFKRVLDNNPSTVGLMRSHAKAKPSRKSRQPTTPAEAIPDLFAAE